MGNGKRILVTFGRSDPLHLTEATHEVLGDAPVYIWGPDFGRPMPEWAEVFPMGEPGSLYDDMGTFFDIVYCGHGATLLEATAAGCEVMVLRRIEPLMFSPAWSGPPHLDHSGLSVRWWEPKVMESMSLELRDRRLGGSTRGVEAPTTGRGVETGRKGDLPPGGASWVHQAWAPR